jgi:hypothetical protein
MAQRRHDEDGGTLFAMSYGANKVVPNYNVWDR